MDLDRLYELAKDGAEPLCEELYGLAYMVKKNAQLMELLSDIGQHKEAKKKIINDVMPRASKLFSEVVSVLIDADLIRDIVDLSEGFTLFLSRKNGIRYDEIIFSEKPSEEILNKFHKIAGDKVRFRIQLDKSILGGFIWKTMDGKIMDASVLGRLSQMREEIAA